MSQPGGPRYQTAIHNPTPVGWLVGSQSKNVLVVAIKLLIHWVHFFIPILILMYCIAVNIRQLLIAKLSVNH